LDYSNCLSEEGDLGKMTELELYVFKRIAVVWHLVRVGKLEDAGGVLIRNCNVLSIEVCTILMWVIKGKAVRMLMSCGSGGEGLL
jgi:hypothetical protein